MPQHRTIEVGGRSVHLAEQGEGPLVLLLHGFPESWYSWRHQFAPLAAAGYHVVAPDQRGYGASDRPEATDQYTIHHLVGDVVGLIQALGRTEAVVCGHDWGATVAWQTALMRPDVVRAVAGLSVPPVPRGPFPPLALARERFGANFYQNYFQLPEIPEAELSRDVATTMRTVLTGSQAEDPAPGLLGGLSTPDVLPDWLGEDDLAVFTEQFERSGFRGPLNWYRNIDRNWELTAAWQGARITPPSLYLSGTDDVVRTFLPFGDPMRAMVPDLHAAIDLPGGHWIQQERPAEVSAALLDFLRQL
ncbi:pimeloyl-ACP methyl ester carboxylesterase [Amycolatopsis sulphurea]|uniref:Pimeloyl-ACP methyl ester carboxylesterase n=1 Tax=Amycolatopsis sulphurea TaxID=76022 RepID=A0A2A9FFT1_9PSEU|nr:alpha/beta hydrolase [Amycolatopsis sulphurea]PFG49626.1 pimeloyl-ACP methyl ester carboxylesterase [Amycolatopsis sulphurea]